MLPRAHLEATRSAKTPPETAPDAQRCAQEPSRMPPRAPRCRQRAQEMQPQRWPEAQSSILEARNRPRDAQTPSRLRFWNKLILKRFWKALKTTCPQDVGTFLAKFGFVMGLLYIWLSEDLLFGFPMEFKRAPLDRPTFTQKLPGHPPGPLVEISEQKLSFPIIR